MYIIDKPENEAQAVVAAIEHIMWGDGSVVMSPYMNKVAQAAIAALDAYRADAGFVSLPKEEYERMKFESEEYRCLKNGEC